MMTLSIEDLQLRCINAPGRRKSHCWPPAAVIVSDTPNIFLQHDPFSDSAPFIPWITSA